MVKGGKDSSSIDMVEGGKDIMQLKHMVEGGKDSS